MKKTIYPCLWFNGNAKEAAEFYCSVFHDTKIVDDNHMVTMMESGGHRLMCLNGGPEFTINSSISFFVVCDMDCDIENAWKRLLEGGAVMMPLDTYPWSPKYGWLRDRFGVNWQLFAGKKEDMDQKFAPSLLFTGKQNGKAEEAINYYTSVFKDSVIESISKYEKNEGDTEGNVKYGQFRLGKKVFRAMDSSGPHQFGFNEAVSFVVECESQEEIDYFWNEFTKEGQESQCGWLKDKYGVSWQIIPEILSQLMSDPAKTQRVVNAFLQMRKFDIAALIKAAEK